ncbi:hypothetical protein [Limnohabitans sp. Rim11]|jgi:hypothetical protein|uniref:hypothetical protein n=1 Tax=Limnohabitans sp. Rim11 TaxID=1100719 RepID=UPI000ABE0362|nr:hypothetical protein [Limnohabitans sp. Rim11]
MGRSQEHNELDPYVKYGVFRKAFSNVNMFKSQGNYLAAHMLIFSILEDRVTAAYVTCYRALNDKNPPQFEDLKKIAFRNMVGNLLAMGVFDETIAEKINSVAMKRNQLTHEMMWRLDCFKEENVDEVRALINEVNKMSRRFAKNHEKTDSV